MKSLLVLIALALSVSNIGAEFHCPAKDGYYADPDNCIKYYHCYTGHKDRLTCPKADDTGEQEFYNPENVWCDYPGNVACGDRPICDENDDNCFQQTTTTEDPNAFHCPGDGYFGNPDDCKCYYHCWGGAIEESLCCPDGQLWNEEHNYCDFVENVICGDRPICGTQGCVTASTSDPNQPEFKCPGDGYWPDPHNCIKYYHCFEGIVEEHITCDKDHQSGGYQCYDPANTWCNFCDEVNCGNRPYCNPDDTVCEGGGGTTSAKPPHTTSKQPPTTSSGPCTELTNHCAGGDGFYAEGDCIRCFCRCFNHVATEQCCPEGLVWNSQENACDFPAHAGCTT